MSHLALEIFDRTGTGSKYATLPPNAEITITDTSALFGSGDIWSWEFRLNIYTNLHIFGTCGDLHGARLHEQVHKRRARLWVDGLPLFIGYLTLDDSADVDADGYVEVKFESGQKTFEQLIEGAKANQVPLMSDVQIGMALWRKRCTCVGAKISISPVLDDSGSHPPFSSDTAVLRHDVHAMMTGDEKEDVTPFPVDGERYTEDEKGTPTHPFCNVALCYQRYGYEKKDENDVVSQDYASEPEAQRGYEVMPADRVNSAPNFYVIYWLRSLMKHLGIHIEENQMMDVEDLRRLFFVNTSCSYKEPKHFRDPRYDFEYGKYTFVEGERYLAERTGPTETADGQTRYKFMRDLVDVTKCKLKVVGFTVGTPRRKYPVWEPVEMPTIEGFRATVNQIDSMSQSVLTNYYLPGNSLLHEAYATSDCFPNADVSETIKAIENGFGVRFLFSSDYKRVRIVLLRNLFRSQRVQDIRCDIVDDDVKTDGNIRGFRMTYGKGKDDSHFYYKGFADLLPHKKELWVDDSDKHDYSHWKLDAEYASLLDRVSAFDKTCYVTPETGNAQIIKVDKDAKLYDEMHPSLFEAAGFMDAEDGDCTGESSTIYEINAGFTPAIMNDVNWEKERSGDAAGPLYALFVDETMRPRRYDYANPSSGDTFSASDAVYDANETGLYGNDEAKRMEAGKDVVQPGNFAVTSDIYAYRSGLRADVDVYVWSRYRQDYGYSCITYPITEITIEGHINEGYRLYLQDNFEPNDDGICPIEKHDWGLTLGIMRGSGSDAHVDYAADPDDGEGNDTWNVVSGSSVTSHHDTCDSYGNLWDYDTGRTVVRTSAQAISALQQLWPDSNLDLIHSSGSTMRDESNAIYSASIQRVDGISLLLAPSEYIPKRQFASMAESYARNLSGMTRQQMRQYDAAHNRWLVETDSSAERMDTLLELEWRAFVYSNPEYPMSIDNGIGSIYGRFSLKLRAEKPNPYFNPSLPENDDTNPRYLAINNPNLRRRGLADQFYTELSYFIRNAKTVKRPVRMELAQLLAIDKTVKVRVGDITGFIKSMQYTVSNETGLGAVVMEIMYI